MTPHEFVPGRRPTLRFVSALLVAIVTFGFVWWCGAIAPRVAIFSDSSQFDHATQRGQIRLDLRNRGALSFEVTNIASRTPAVSVALRDRAVRVPGRSHRRVRVEFTVDCASLLRPTMAKRGPSFAIVLDLTTNSVVHVTKTITTTIITASCAT